MPTNGQWNGYNYGPGNQVPGSLFMPGQPSAAYQNAQSGFGSGSNPLNEQFMQGGGGGGMPTMPQTRLPNIPTLGNVTLPGVPELPQFQSPDLPQMQRTEVGALPQLDTSGIDDLFNRESIDKLIADQRRAGAQGIGSQLGAANQSTASQLASRGLGTSTITTGALAGNQAQALEARAQLEGDLSGQELTMMRDLAGMKQQQELTKFQAESNRVLQQANISAGENQAEFQAGVQSALQASGIQNQRDLTQFTAQFQRDLAQGNMDFSRMKEIFGAEVQKQLAQGNIDAARQMAEFNAQFQMEMQQRQQQFTRGQEDRGFFNDLLDLGITAAIFAFNPAAGVAYGANKFMGGGGGGGYDSGGWNDGAGWNNTNSGGNNQEIFDYPQSTGGPQYA